MKISQYRKDQTLTQEDQETLNTSLSKISKAAKNEDIPFIKASLIELHSAIFHNNLSTIIKLSEDLKTELQSILIRTGNGKETLKEILDLQDLID